MTDEYTLFQRLNMTDEEYKDWLWMMNMSESLKGIVVSDKTKNWLEEYKNKKYGKI